MIVKNEMTNLEHYLSAVADQVGYWVIGDAGSADFACLVGACRLAAGMTERRSPTLPTLT
jgi:hypothetical protein